MKPIVSSPAPKKLPLIVALLIPTVGASTANAQCVHGDPDGSGTVGLPDFAAFVDCTTGPDNGPAPPGCGPIDFDHDTDVDLLDFGHFQQLFGVTHGVFFGHREFFAGEEPANVAIGDLDGDGDLDLAVASGRPQVGGGKVGILLNNGDGTFAPVVQYSAGSQPVAVAIGDLDGEGDLDLAVASRTGGSGANGTVAVLLNHGDGTFGDPVFHSVGDETAEVVIADLNGDGDLDLAVLNRDSSDIILLLNDGDGAFAAETLIVLQENPQKNGVWGSGR